MVRSLLPFGLPLSTSSPVDVDNVLDTLLDLHAKLSTVVRYYDRMLEERLSSAYSQHSLGYGSAPANSPYPNVYPSVPPPAPETRTGAESFYYGTPGEQPPAAAPYAPPADAGGHRGGAMSPVAYAPPSAQPMPSSAAWTGRPPSVASPPAPSAAAPAYPGPPAGYPLPPPQGYTSPTATDPSAQPYYPQPGEPGTPSHAAPGTRRDSYYQSAGLPTAPVPSAPEPSAPAVDGYPPPAGSGHQRQPSYYYQPPPPQAGSQHPPYAPGAPPGSHAVGDVSPLGPSAAPVPGSQPAPARPAVEESLIEL